MNPQTANPIKLKRFKLTGDERHEHIIEAVRCVFAQKGFKGATTRELAGAAGVSEALLFKHFPNKEAIYRAMLDQCCAQDSACEWENIAAMRPSTATLIHIVRHLVTFLTTKNKRNPAALITDRLLLRSLCEDGIFARVMLGQINEHVVKKLEASLKAAWKSGDLTTKASFRTNGWLVLYVGMMIVFSRLPQRPVVDFGIGNEKLIEDAVAFCLRGLGVREEAMGRC